MKKISTILLLILFVTLPSCQMASYNNLNDHKDSLWSLKSDWFTVFFRDFHSDKLVIKEKYISSIDINTGQYEVISVDDIRYFDNNIEVSQINEDDKTCRLVMKENGRLVWSKTHSKGFMVSIGGSLYFVKKKGVSKISLDNGSTQWSLPFDETASLKFFKSKEYLYVYKIFNQEYYVINDVSGQYRKITIDPLVNNTHMPNFTGFMIDDELFYINKNKKLMKVEDNKIVDDWSNIIEENSITVSEIGENIITFNNKPFMPSAYMTYEENYSPYSNIDKFDYKHTCIVKLFNRETNGSQTLNERYNLNIIYAYSKDNNVIAITKDQISAFDSNFDNLWTISFDQIKNFNKDNVPYVVWSNKEFVVLFENGETISCYKITKQ